MKTVTYRRDFAFTIFYLFILNHEMQLLDRSSAFIHVNDFVITTLTL